MPHLISRRGALGAAVASLMAPLLAGAADGKAPKHILLRSSWQTVNIGDIAHTPGLLHELEQYLPDAKVTLWPNPLDRGVADMLQRAFPKLTIMKPTKEEIAAVLERCWNNVTSCCTGPGRPWSGGRRWRNGTRRPESPSACAG